MNRAAMNQLSNLPERAMHLAGQVGSGIRDAVPDKAVQWVETGAALAALRTGGRAATRIVKRNPALAAAALAGAGLLWLAARRRAKRRDQEAEGGSKSGPRRVEARRAPRTRTRRTAAASRSS